MADPAEPKESPQTAEAAERTVYQERRARLLDQMGDGVFVLQAEPEGDLDPFHQDHYYYYLTGIDEGDGVLVLTRDGEKTGETLFLPERNPDRERWDGVRMGLMPGEKANAELSARAGVATIRRTRDFHAALHRLLRKSDATLHTVLLPVPLDQPLNARTRFVNACREHYPLLTIADARPTLDNLRRIKDAHELELLQQSIDITGEAHAAAMRTMRPGLFEYQIQAVIEQTYTDRGAAFKAFPSIVGSGFNSTVLHYRENTKRIEKGDLIVIDIGAEYAHYSADVTRTLPASGKFTRRQREIYAIVLEAQKRAIAEVRPGKKIRADVHKTAYDYIKSQGYGEYFIHGTSHFLGMDVHDVGDYDLPLEPGVVITVEPGIYLPEEALGVRIEDDILVTSDEPKVLSAHIPREIAEIERVMAEKD